MLGSGETSCKFWDLSWKNGYFTWHAWGKGSPGKFVVLRQIDVAETQGVKARGGVRRTAVMR